MAKKGDKGLGAADQKLIDNWQAKIDANAAQQQGAPTKSNSLQQGDNAQTLHGHDPWKTRHPDEVFGPNYGDNFFPD